MTFTPELSREVADIIGHAWVPPSEEDRNKIIDAMYDAETYDDLPEDIKSLLDSIKNQPIPDYYGPGFRKTNSRSESRASRNSTVERRIVKQANICERCRLNNDPNNVPVHPNCDCDVITDSIESGVADPQSRFFNPLTARQIAMEMVSAEEGIELPAGIQLNPDTVSILEGENVRFADLARWLEQMQPYLEEGAQYLSIVVDDDTDEAVQQVSDTLENVASGLEDIPEALRHKKLWFALAKAVVF
jgi:hypothetical protein